LRTTYKSAFALCIGILLLLNTYVLNSCHLIP
jgi:hypothetical protein